MSKYLELFCYPLNNRLFAQKLVLTNDIIATNPEDVFATFQNLGALLAIGREEKFKSTLDGADFSILTYTERAEFVLLLFKFYSAGKDDLTLAPETAAALLALCNKLLPELSVPIENGLQHGDKCRNNKLIDLAYAKQISNNVRGVIFFRENFCGRGSRKHELGLRIKSGLASQGWSVTLLSNEDAPRFYSAQRYDFALVDVDVLLTGDMQPALDILLHLKRTFRKIMIIVPDPWVSSCISAIDALSESIDFVWGFASDWPAVHNHKFDNKIILLPGPSGFDRIYSPENDHADWRVNSFSFTGSVEFFNVSRVLWVLESIARKLPIKFTVTSPGIDDGLDREASLTEYANSLMATTVALNFTTRSDGSQMVIPGRAIEVISLNRLLLQETCPGFHSYFVEGEHFFEFSGVEDYCSTIDFLRSHPKTAKLVASEGYMFYKSRYSSRKMVEHFQTILDS